MMGKTIVNIITPEHPVAAYLFIKEMYEPGDRLLFVAANEDFGCITPEYVSRMWGGKFSLEEIDKALKELRASYYEL